MKNLLKWFKNEESGQGMVEYALIIALVSVAVILVLGVLSGAIKGVFNKAAGELSV